MYIMAQSIEELYNQNTYRYGQMTTEEKRVMELHGKMDHSMREYQREMYVYVILNIVTMGAAIAAYKYLAKQ
jgi:hypothetical protein